jgi:acetolactate decarboxylase
VPLDERFTRSLHVETMRRAGLLGDAAPHAVFQASTIGALLEGRFEGDAALADLAAHGDLGLGTLDHLDGELIVLDGRFLRADVDGRLSEVPPETGTPFAAVVPFRPEIEVRVEAPAGRDELLAAIERAVPPESGACAFRVDGSFAMLRARSVPRQEPPYRPLAEVVADQHVFDLGPCEGTIVGLRFPEHAEELEVAGFHLHFATADRGRGGHVLDLEAEEAVVRIDVLSELHVELPPGVELEAPHVEGDVAKLLRRVERAG